MAQALGARFLDGSGAQIARGGAALRDLDRIVLDRLDPRLRDVELVVAGDVRNPLLGSSGAAAVYGPQKGAGAADVAVLEEGLSRLAAVTARDLGVDLGAVPGAGAAGGAGGGAVAFLGARLVSGIELLLDIVRFRDTVRRADLVVTGEGSLDEQSLAGKAPWGVAQAAARAGVPTVALVGRLCLTQEQVRTAGFAGARALTDLEPDVDRCRRDAAPLLTRLARTLLDTT
jgi:glycerate kinase